MGCNCQNNGGLANDTSAIPINTTSNISPIDNPGVIKKSNTPWWEYALIGGAALVIGYGATTAYKSRKK